MNKKILAGMTTAAIAASLVCAGLVSAEEEPVTLKFYHNWTQEDQPQFFIDLADEFMEAHPNVTIEITNVGDPDYTNKLNIQMGSDDAPDVFYTWSGEYINKFIRSGQILDLTSYLDEAPEWRDSFVPAAIDIFDYTKTEEKDTYAIPYRVDGKVMVYNKDIFEEYGLTAPATWDEFLAVCQTLKDNDVIPVALGATEGWTSCHYITTFNAQYVSKDVRLSDYQYDSGDFSDPGYVDALNKYTELADLGYFTPNAYAVDFYAARNDFFVGKAAMTYMQAEEFHNFSDYDLNVGCFILPAAEDCAGIANVMTGAPDGFCVSAGCKNPEIAVEWLKYITSAENEARMVDVFDTPAAVQGVMNDSNSTELMLQFVDLYENADDFANWLDSDINSEVANVYVPGIQEVLGGTMTAEELMEEVHEIAVEISEE